MSSKTPNVAGPHLFDPDRPGQMIWLDSPAWFAWLEQPTTTRFSYPLFDPTCGYVIGVMTVRKEPRRRKESETDDRYWAAFRRCRGKLRKIYLGRSTAVTQARLSLISYQLLAWHRLPSPTD